MIEHNCCIKEKKGERDFGYYCTLTTDNKLVLRYYPGHNCEADVMWYPQDYPINVCPMCGFNPKMLIDTK